MAKKYSHQLVTGISFGLTLITLLNFYIVTIKKEKPAKLIFQHILITVFVIIVSYGVGNLIKKLF